MGLVFADQSCAFSKSYWAVRAIRLLTLHYASHHWLLHDFKRLWSVHTYCCLYLQQVSRQPLHTAALTYTDCCFKRSKQHMSRPCNHTCQDQTPHNFTMCHLGTSHSLLPCNSSSSSTARAHSLQDHLLACASRLYMLIQPFPFAYRSSRNHH